jgi:hypothetical protein
VVTVIEGFRINMDIVMDSDTGLNLEKRLRKKKKKKLWLQQ